MILIGTDYGSMNNLNVAFRIYGNKVEVDTSFNVKSEEFISRFTIDLKAEPIFEKIYKLPIQDLKSYEEKINETNCDYITQMFIIIEENGKESIIEWKGVDNCYPESLKDTVEELDRTFQKYRP